MDEEGGGIINVVATATISAKLSLACATWCRPAPSRWPGQWWWCRATLPRCPQAEAQAPVSLSGPSGPSGLSLICLFGVAEQTGKQAQRRSRRSRGSRGSRGSRRSDEAENATKQRKQRRCWQRVLEGCGTSKGCEEQAGRGGHSNQPDKPRSVGRQQWPCTSARQLQCIAAGQPATWRPRTVLCVLFLGRLQL